jgi:hypothetical protein
MAGVRYQKGVCAKSRWLDVSFLERCHQDIRYAYLSNSEQHYQEGISLSLLQCISIQANEKVSTRYLFSSIVSLIHFLFLCKHDRYNAIYVVYLLKDPL